MGELVGKFDWHVKLLAEDLLKVMERRRQERFNWRLDGREDE